MTGPERSPLAQAEEAKRRRDLAGEIGALMSAGADLDARPWAPVRPGDVVLCWFDLGDMAYGQTFLAVDDEGFDVNGHAMLREVSSTPMIPVDEPDSEAGQPVAPELIPFYDLWFEVGPASMTVIRAGAVVHGQPARGTR